MAGSLRAVITRVGALEATQNGSGQGEPISPCGRRRIRRNSRARHLFSIKQRASDRSRPEHSAHPSDLPASGVPAGRQHDWREGRCDCILQGPRRRSPREAAEAPRCPHSGRAATSGVWPTAKRAYGFVLMYHNALWVLRRWERRRRSGRPSSSTMACRRVQASTSVCGCRMPAVNAPAPR